MMPYSLGHVRPSLRQGCASLLSIYNFRRESRRKNRVWRFAARVCSESGPVQNFYVRSFAVSTGCGWLTRSFGSAACWLSCGSELPAAAAASAANLRVAGTSLRVTCVHTLFNVNAVSLSYVRRIQHLSIHLGLFLISSNFISVLSILDCPFGISCR